jgi:hypothetical protein
MGLVVGTAKPVQGFGPILELDVKKVREKYAHFEEVCPTPTLWERAFYELLDCFDSPEACSKAFKVLDSDNDGFVDARETFGALAILCKGHLSERLKLLFDMFDLNKENDMGFDEAFLMLRRTSNGLRKITGLVAPPEQVIQIMVQQIWKYAKKHRDVRIRQEDWHAWWERDAICRRALQAFVLRPEDQRGLPTPDKWLNVDYAKDAAGKTSEEAGSASLMAPSRSIVAERKVNSTSHEALLAAMDGGTAARQGKSPSPEVTGGRPASCTPVVDYEELVRDGLTDSPFLIAEKDALDANKAPMIAQ